MSSPRPNPHSGSHHRQISIAQKFRRPQLIATPGPRSRSFAPWGSRTRLYHANHAQAKLQLKSRVRRPRGLGSSRLTIMSGSDHPFPAPHATRTRRGSVATIDDATRPSAATAPRGRDRLAINFLANAEPSSSSSSLPPHMQRFARPRTTSNLDPSQMRRAVASSSRLNPGQANTAVAAGSFDPRGRVYHLEVVQHPEKSAEFGLATLSRLPLAPPLIVQLTVRDQTGASARVDNEIPFLVAHLSLFTGDGSTPLDVANDARGPAGQPPGQRLLYGTLVSSPHYYRNTQGHMGHYFIFPDVSIRCQGRYLLKITLMRLSRNGVSGVMGIGEHGSVLATAVTRPFEVVSQHNYRAPPPTALTQYFLQQGARMTCGK